MGYPLPGLSMSRVRHGLTRGAGLLLILSVFANGCRFKDRVAVPPDVAPTSSSSSSPDNDSVDQSILRTVPLVVATYRSIHEHPELGKQEVETHDLLVSELQRLGYRDFVTSSRLPTAVIAVLDSHRPGPTIALRSEMDARKTQEPAGHSPRSKVDGLMHNCGHDAHAAILLGVASVLKEQESTLRGRVVFLFQPAEETKGGADDVVAEGILPRLGVRAIFAQHAAPGLPVGTVSISPGATLAGSTTLSILVHGRGSHAAMPWQGDDVPLAAAKIVQSLADLPARRIDLLRRPTVISVAYISAGDESSTNVLPTDAVIRGTVRSFEDIDHAEKGTAALRADIEARIAGTTKAAGVTYDLKLEDGSPPTVNDPQLFASLIPQLQSSWPGVIDTTPVRFMVSEDFAFYTKSIPALYFGLGVERDGLGSAGVHSPEFTIHPAALTEGVRLLALTARTALSANTN